MADAFTFPTSVVIGLWLNAAQAGAVTPTDCANAIETVTDQVDINFVDHAAEFGSTSWLGVVNQAVLASSPVVAGLPVNGDPAGLPADVLARITWESGVVAIDPNLLLCHSSDGVWALFKSKHNVMPYDLTQTRRSLEEHLASAAKQLAASDLVGDEAQIVRNLNEFKSLHLPPHLSKRSTDALELAARILIISRGAIVNTNALHSPSLDRVRVQTFEQLILQSRTVLQSVVIG